MSRRFADCRLFFQEFRQNFYATGALLPSSRTLARALARFVSQTDRTGRRILEVGPGTGAVTRAIVVGMQPDDRLVLVEVNQRFVERLQELFQTDFQLSQVADRVEVLHGHLEDLVGSERYDLVISGIPFNNFGAVEVERLLKVELDCLTPGGILSFFEYIAVRRVRSLVGGSQERVRMHQITAVLDAVFERHEVRRERIWSNLPPAWVHHLGIPKAGCTR